MSRRRSSIRGKGAEILFGVPPAVEIQPRAPNLALVDTGPPAPEALLQGVLSDAEVEEALLEEATSGSPLPEEGCVDQPGGQAEPPAEEVVETTPSEEAAGAEGRPEPTANESIPILEETMQEQELERESALYEPPPPESDDVAVGVLPPRRESMYAGLAYEESAARDIQAPDEEAGWLELPERALTEEEKQQLLIRLGRARIQELDEQIDDMYDQVLDEVGENEQIATECYNLLLKARDILFHRDVSKIPQAEYYIEQVRARLKRADESESGARKAQWWILCWGLLWCGIFLALVLLFNQAWFRALVAPPGGGRPLVDVTVFLSAAVWGGIGGVVAILYSLFKHVGQRDFDSQYSISYIGKPFLGLILGATVYMIFNLLVRALGIWPAGLEGATESLAVAPGVIYLMAWACGFKENRIFDLVDRVMKRLFSGGPKPEQEPIEEHAEAAEL
jgi:hypothetical protein